MAKGEINGPGIRLLRIGPFKAPAYKGVRWGAKTDPIILLAELEAPRPRKPQRNSVTADYLAKLVAEFEVAKRRHGTSQRQFAIERGGAAHNTVRCHLRAGLALKGKDPSFDRRVATLSDKLEK